MIRCGTWEKYEEFKKEKAEKGRQREKARRAAEEQGAEEPQIEGQIRMDLVPAEEPKAEMSEQTKMMRFLAGRFELIEKSQALGVEILRREIDKLNDTLSMILRAVRKE